MQISMNVLRGLIGVLTIVTTMLALTLAPVTLDSVSMQTDMDVMV